MGIDVGQHFQDCVLRLCITDGEVLRAVKDKIRPEFFTAGLTGNLYRLCVGYYSAHGEAPDGHFGDEAQRAFAERDQGDRADCLAYLKKLQEMPAPNRGYVLRRVTEYVNVAVRREAVVEMAEYLERGQWEEADGAIRRAWQTAVEVEAAGGCDLIPYSRFPTATLPEVLGRFVAGAAEAVGVDEGFVAAPVLSVVAAAIGPTRQVELKSTWREPAIIWTAIIGKSGSKKSPALDMALEPLRELQVEAARDHQNDVREFVAASERYKQAMKAWRGSADDAEPMPQGPVPPAVRRFYTVDTTVEALAALLEQNPRGLLVSPGELSAWLGSFDAYKGGRANCDAAKYLDLFHGRTLIVDRKSADPIYIEHAAVSITGGIQPEVLRRMLRREHYENGMAARFLLLKPPPVLQEWTDEQMDPEAREDYGRMIRRLHRLDFVTGADDQPRPRVLELTQEAAGMWAEFYDEHAMRLLTADGDLAAAFSKLEGYCARLALVFCLVRWAANRRAADEPEAVGRADMQAAVALTQWWRAETERLYRCLRESEEQAQLRALYESVQAHGGRMTVPEFQRTNANLYRTANLARAALQRLADAGMAAWERSEPGPKGGRPSLALVLEGSA